MSRADIATQLRAWVRAFAIDPADAEEIFREIPSDGLDAVTFGDYLDGAGYPELASQAYGMVAS